MTHKKVTPAHHLTIENFFENQRFGTARLLIHLGMLSWVTSSSKLNTCMYLFSNQVYYIYIYIQVVYSICNFDRIQNILRSYVRQRDVNFSPMKLLTTVGEYSVAASSHAHARIWLAAPLLGRQNAMSAAAMAVY